MNDQKTDRDEIQKKIDEIESKSAGGGYIFRGEPECYPKSSSKLYRDFEIDDDNFNIAVVEEEMLEAAKKHTGRRSKEFRQDALSRAVEAPLEKNADFELLTEIQHYGGKTNLIDFTEDYSVALFFACQSKYGKDGADGRVILQKIDDLEKAGMIAYPEKPRHRVVAQKSVFVRPPRGFIENLTEDIIVVIPRALKEPIRVWLQDYHGISTESIYNDVHGFIINQDIHGDFYTNFYKSIANINRGDELNDREDQ